MKKLVMSAIIALGLAVGFGFTSEVSACDDCATNANSVSEFARNVRDEHIEFDNCTEDHMLCEMCDGYFCDNLTCWCGSEMSHVENCWCEDHFVCEECDELFCMELLCECDEMIVMSEEEFYEFEDYIYELYIEEYCINECEECDYYYYEECMCNACEDDCYGCIMYDFELFVEDEFEMIMDEYYEVIRGIIDERARANEVEIVICEF